MRCPRFTSPRRTPTGRPQNEYWDSKGELVEEDIEHYSEELGEKLIHELELPIAEEFLNAQQSNFFKTVYVNPSRNPKKGT